MENKEYMCILVHCDECINNNDCENCPYGVTEESFKETYSQLR